MKKVSIATVLVLGLVLAARSQVTQVCQPDTIYLQYNNSLIDFGNSMRLVMSYNTSGYNNLQKIVLL